jgi:hypothetical protein
MNATETAKAGRKKRPVSADAGLFFATLNAPGQAGTKALLRDRRFKRLILPADLGQSQQPIIFLSGWS